MLEAGYTAVWEFRVRPGEVEGFVAAYGPAGTWARLFRRAEGYLGTEMLRDPADPLRFVTVDRWRSRADFDAFKATFAADYAALDARCERLTASERQLDDPRPVC